MHSTQPAGLHRTALRLLIVVVALAAAAVVVSWAAGASVHPFRMVVYAAMLIAALAEIRRPEPDAAPVLGLVYLLWGGISALDLAVEADLGHQDRLTIGVALMILSLVVPFFRQGAVRRVTAAFGLANGLWVATTGISVGVDPPDLMNQVLAMLVGYWMLSLMNRRFLEQADLATRQAERSASIQLVLASISQALIVNDDDRAVDLALGAVGRWIGCDAAVVEIYDPGSVRPRRVVARFGELPEPERLADGGIDDDEAIGVALWATGPISGVSRVVPAGNGYSYRETLIPVPVRGEVRGALTVFWSVGSGQHDQFTEHILQRAAELIGAHWDRVESNARLRRLVESKDRFIASVSHELRTPLTAVIGFTQEMLVNFDELDHVELQDYLRLVAQQGAEVSQIVEDLLVAARADLGTLTIRPSGLDVKKEAEVIVDHLRLTALEHRAVEVIGEPTAAWADPLRTRQIIRNLLTNAGRYGGPTIRVETGGSGQTAWIRVTDDGSGIPADKLESVFRPYVSAHERAGQPGAMGLGLAVARDLARLMGGDIALRSQPGLTTFEVSLPSGPSLPAASMERLARSA